MTKAEEEYGDITRNYRISLWPMWIEIIKCQKNIYMALNSSNNVFIFNFPKYGNKNHKKMGLSYVWGKGFV